MDELAKSITLNFKMTSKIVPQSLKKRLSNAVHFQEETGKKETIPQ
jgi:hypothetical protein